MTTNENNGFNHFKTNFGIYLFEMATTENQSRILSKATTGIYLLEMTTTENEYIKGEATHVGIDLLEMTTIENWLLLILKCSNGYLPAWNDNHRKLVNMLYLFTNRYLPA